MFYMVPVAKIINEIDLKKENVILTGPSGSGKSVVIKALKNKNYNADNIIVDGTINETIRMDYPNYFCLYHSLLLIQKILLSIKIEETIENYLKKYSHFESEINALLEQMEILLMTNDSKRVFVMEELLNNPELLFQRLNNLISKDIQDRLVIIIDNFDNIGVFDNIYQPYMFNILNKYFHYLITLSSKPNINIPNTKVIEVSYTNELESVKKILSDTYDLNPDSPLLNDELITTLIKESNGNINFILWAYRKLVENKKEMTPSEYPEFIKNYFANLRELFTPRERKLYINK